MKNILFDLDGTLTDSGEGIMHCAELTLAHYGLPVPTRTEMRVIVGPPLRESFHRFGIQDADLEDAIEFYRKHYMAVGQFENTPYPGIEELLQRLKAEGHKLYVATSKPENMAKGILEYFDLAQYFTIICGAVSDGDRHTKEAVIEHLLSIMEDRNDLVMIGDTIYDVNGANYHQIPCIGVTWGYGVIEDMRSAGATIADSTDALYQLLK